MKLKHLIGALLFTAGFIVASIVMHLVDYLQLG